MLPSFDLAHVGTLYSNQPGQFLLSDALVHAERAHSLAKSLGWLGFISGCARGTPPLNSTPLHRQKRQAVTRI